METGELTRDWLLSKGFKLVYHNGAGVFYYLLDDVEIWGNQGEYTYEGQEVNTIEDLQLLMIENFGEII